MGKDTIIQWDNKLLKWDKALIRTEIAVPSTPDPWPTDNLVARWPLTANLVDTVGSSTFNVKAGSATYDADGLVFDGTNVFYVSGGSIGSTFHSNNEFSISMWLKMTTNTNGRQVFSVTPYDTIPVGSGDFPSTFYQNHPLAVDGYFQRCYSGGTQSNVQVAETVLNTLRHFVFYYKHSTTKIGYYMDGNYKSEGTSNIDMGTTQTTLWLGAGPGGSDRMIGKMKYLYIYNKLLSSTEVTTLYNSGTPL